MRKIVIFGAAEQAELAHFYFVEEGKYDVVGFVVDDEFLKENSFCGKPVVAFSRLTELYPPSDFSAFVALGYTRMNALRETKYYAMKALGYDLVSYISSFCHCFTKDIGDNCLILEDNTIQPFVKIGNNVTLWSGNHIGHHSQIGDHAFITSHVVVSGGVKIGPNCFLGVNATIRDHIKIGDYSLIGAGAIITKDTEVKSLYKGVRSCPENISSDQIRI